MDGLSDLAFFTELMRYGSLAALARELGVTPPAVSKRLFLVEERLGAKLLHRTTRRISLTHEGELYLQNGARILSELNELESAISASRAVPKGLLRVNATFGFGRKQIAPAVSDFVRRYPEVEVQLQLTDRAVSLQDSSFDIGIRFGGIPDARIFARKIAANNRFLYAAPRYLAHAGMPTNPTELAAHSCIVIRESDTAYGTWHLIKGNRTETVKVRATLSTNDGEVALDWALKDHGIILRSEWDAAPFLRSRRLVRVLPDWSTPSADIFAVYAEKASVTAKVSVFLDFLSERFRHHLTMDQESTW
jgi:LysR family transcriptional regulator, transcriptional activator for dmlA